MVPLPLYDQHNSAAITKQSALVDNDTQIPIVTLQNGATPFFKFILRDLFNEVFM